MATGDGFGTFMYKYVCTTTICQDVVLTWLRDLSSLGRPHRSQSELVLFGSLDRVRVGVMDNLANRYSKV